MSRPPLQIQYRDLDDAGLAAQLARNLVGNGFITFQNHDGIAARRRAIELHGGDVDAVLAQAGGHCRYMAGGVLIVLLSAESRIKKKQELEQLACLQDAG